MTKRHMEAAAEQVKAILQGDWTFIPPSWAPEDIDTSDATFDDASERNAWRVRAVWTAEAYIQLFTRFNPLFNQKRFLAACGLSDAR